jgi:hypothetical protein
MRERTQEIKERSSFKISGMKSRLNTVIEGTDNI